MSMMIGTGYPGHDDDMATDGTGLEADAEAKFEPGYEVDEGKRIYRQRLHVNPKDGTATVTFRGDLDATQIWIERGTSGRLAAYAEVSLEATTITEVTFAVVPTGKRVPLHGLRLGSHAGQHTYLIGVQSYRAAGSDATGSDAVGGGSTV